MKNSHLALLLLGFLGATAAPGQAEVRLPAIISDHMVLQQEIGAPIWGWAEVGETVTVKIGGQTKTAQPAADGRWSVKLDPLSSKDALTLTVQGKNTLTIQDVLVGEVWLGSGQSNMAMLVQSAKDFAQEQAAAQLPQVRMFTEQSGAAGEPQQIGRGSWVVCTPETVGRFSATLFFFGRELHRVLGRPVGLINSSVGGTPIESWIDADTQRKTPELAGFFQLLRDDQAKVNPEAQQARYEKELAAYQEAVKKAEAEKLPRPRPPRNPAAVRARRGNVGGLFNGKIAPLIPYGVRGMLWYQGEANGSPAKAPYYQHQLPLLITDWRARWGLGDVPFAWVQLPNFGESAARDWPTIREGMRQTLRLKNTGMAIAIDLGEAKDIHPKNKQEVGRRLSLWALGTVYGKEVPATSGPLPEKVKSKGNTLTVSFTHADGGLTTGTNGEAPRGFELSGADGQWKSAAGTLEGSSIILTAEGISAPVSVRYAWKNWPDANLRNSAGLPASPFCERASGQ